MTTIATDGITIAADGLGVCGGERTWRDMKKIRVVDGRIYGCTGDAPLFDALIKWHKDGSDPSKYPKVENQSGCLLVIDDRGLVRYTHTCPYADAFPYPAAFGSGADYASMAMHLGLSPRDAVEKAAHFDVHTGGTITEINIAEALAGTIVPIKAAGRNRR